tara:strand:+ start:385 stop:1026 length:642 start_codon:yes stop_codon:yes gene_type:complete
MNKIVLVLSIFFFNFLFSQDARDSDIVSDFKIGVYENMTENQIKDSLGIFISKANRNASFNLCIDVFANKTKDLYNILGIAIDDDKLDIFYRNLNDAYKEFDARKDQNVVVGNIKIGRQVPVRIYQSNLQVKHGPVQRIGKTQHQKYFPLSFELLNINSQYELWIYTNGESSNAKEIAIVLKSLKEIDKFLYYLNPSLVRQNHHNHFNMRGKK